MLSGRIHNRIQLFSGVLIAIAAAWILMTVNDLDDKWLIASAATLTTSLVWSSFRKAPAGLMFLFSVAAMAFAVIYWPIPKGVNPSEYRINPEEFIRPLWYFVAFVLFAYLFWFNKKRW